MSEIVDAEVVEEETEEHGTEIVPAEFSRPVITPDEAKAAAEELRELVAKVLVKDKHYMTTKRKQKRGNQWVEVERDVLLKAGAEELGKVFNLAAEYEDLQTKREEGIFYASVKCSAVNANGRRVGQSYGFFDSTERKNKDGSLQDTPANTIVKMAQKRAYVGAIMAATGTSELFTQDIEDAQPGAGGGIEDRASTAEERLLLKELFAKKGNRTIIQAGDWLKEQGAKGESQLWVARQVLTLILKPDPEPELPAEPSPAAEQMAEGEDLPFEEKPASYHIHLPGRDGKEDYDGPVVMDLVTDHIAAAAGPLKWSEGKRIGVLQAWVEKNGGEIVGVS
jgi:hypothetical protein